MSDLRQRAKQLALNCVDPEGAGYQDEDAELMGRIERALLQFAREALTEAMNDCARIAAQEENAGHRDGVGAAGRIEASIFALRHELSALSEDVAALSAQGEE